MFRRLLMILLALFAVPAFSAGKPAYQTPGPVHLDKAGEKWAKRR